MKCPHCNGTGNLSPDEINVGSLIFARRKALGWTQQQLAARVGFSRSQIANIEVGKSDLPLRTLARYAEALECSMKDLVP